MRARHQVQAIGMVYAKRAFSAHFPLASWSWKWLRQHSRNCSANVEQNMLFRARNRVKNQAGSNKHIMLWSLGSGSGSAPGRRRLGGLQHRRTPYSGFRNLGFRFLRFRLSLGSSRIRQRRCVCNSELEQSSVLPQNFGGWDSGMHVLYYNRLPVLPDSKPRGLAAHPFCNIEPEVEGT